MRQGRSPRSVAAFRRRISSSPRLTRTAPTLEHGKAVRPRVAYRKLLIEGIAESIVRAHEALRPAAVGHAVRTRCRTRSSTAAGSSSPARCRSNPFGEMDQVKMNPGTTPDVLDRPAGPTDPDVTILSVRDAKGRKPLALFRQLRPALRGRLPKGQVSADYFGEFARLMPFRLRAGEEFVAMMSNGTSGDINNLPFLVTRPPREPFEQIRIVARKAADAAWFAWKRSTRHRSDVRLGMIEREITLSRRRPTAEQIERAKAILAMNDEAETSQAAATGRSLRPADPCAGRRRTRRSPCRCRRCASATWRCARSRSRRSSRSAWT